MALQKPFGLNLQGLTIDASEVNTMSWTVTGAISVAFSIEVLDNSTNLNLWTLPKTSSYATKFELPSLTIPNGKECKWRVTIYDDQNQSATSDFVIFQTSKRPAITLESLGIIGSPSYVFRAAYSQNENVSLRSWIAILYDSNQNRLHQTPISTASEIEYLVNNLKSKTDYYIEFQATSAKGLTGSTGKVRFSVLYTQPEVNVSLTASNVSDKAGISLSWQVIQIIGKYPCGTPIFIDNERIDLRNGCKVIYDEGFKLDQDFTMKLWIEDPNNKEDLFVIQGENGTIKLQYHLLDERFHLYKIINGIVSSWISEPISANNYYVCIRQIDRDMDVIASLDA